MSERLRHLLHQYFNKTETAQERDELMRLINNPALEPLVYELMEDVYKAHHLEDDPFAAGVRERMLTAALAGHSDGQPCADVTPIKRTFKWLYAAAALLVLALSVGIYQYRSVMNGPKPTLSRLHHDVKPGGNKAVLTLANGSKIQLDDAGNGSLARQGNTSVVKLANGSVVYKPGVANTREPFINTMSTPKGGQYRLQLPDGTRVMLNAQSSITYPTAFTGNLRKVKITGEVYFEVAKNKKMPFQVSFGNERVEVLGTHFDISAYADQPHNQTTLLEGSVRLSLGDKKQMLVPGQQGIYDKDAQKFNVEAVDTEDIVAWTNGLFVFDNTDLGRVLQELSRWYNVDFVFKGAKPNLHFTGLIKRDIALSRALKMIETTSAIKFTIAENNKVIIEKKQTDN